MASYAAKASRLRRTASRLLPISRATSRQRSFGSPDACSNNDFKYRAFAKGSHRWTPEIWRKPRYCRASYLELTINAGISVGLFLASSDAPVMLLRLLANLGFCNSFNATSLRLPSKTVYLPFSADVTTMASPWKNPFSPIEIIKSAMPVFVAKYSIMALSSVPTVVGKRGLCLSNSIWSMLSVLKSLSFMRIPLPVGLQKFVERSSAARHCQ